MIVVERPGLPGLSLCEMLNWAFMATFVQVH